MESESPAESRRSSVKAFISYSHADRVFVRSLDATLRLAGVETFLDEKDVKIGDSIPEWVYKSIASATHLIYVISKHSVQSPWVREELDVAKVHEKAHEGFKVLPVVIDDSVDIPVAVRHLKYADFTEWQSPIWIQCGGD